MSGSGECRGDDRLDLRPLTARSLMASMLLGSHPPELPVRVLVAAADLFGLSEGAARTALSRMVGAGELKAADGRYTLGPVLLARQQRQDRGRFPEVDRWNGRWRVLIATADRRAADQRAAARARLGEWHFAELREGVWIRPDNLGARDLFGPNGLVADDWTAGRIDLDAAPDVDELWGLGEWAERARALDASVVDLTAPLEAGDRSVLASGFLVAAAGLRVLRDDPLLPVELLDPAWPAAEVRANYDRFDRAYRAVLRGFFAEQRR